MFLLIKWMLMMALLAGCGTQWMAQSDATMESTDRTPVQVDSCTGRREYLTAGWHWYDYVFGIPLGMLGFYDPGRTAD